MGVIKHVYETSPFYGKVEKGDKLIRINDTVINDFLDYTYYFANMMDEEGEYPEVDTSIMVLRKGKELSFNGIVKEGDLRLDFENSLMDEQRACKNKCVFCFIDQLPKNMRKTMYYKDDDFRLSLIYGNYVTLTNLTDNDVERICKMRVSPLNISVHTTNPELRVKMMKNPNAGNILYLLKRFAEARINMRAQIVLCKGLNDGEELDKTLDDLKSLYPAISSVSIVPVGLTKHREGLYPLETFEEEDCKKVVEQINKVGDKCLEEYGTRLFYPSDEFFVKGNIPLPGYSYYEEFEQIENGVGMLMSFAQEFHDIMQTFRKIDKEIDISMATGVLVKPFMETIVNGLKKRLPNLNCRIYDIKNDFYGHKITVAGLVTGQDIISQLKGKPLGSHLLIPGTMLRGNLFLDDVSTYKLGKELDVKIKKAGDSAEQFVRAVVACAKKEIK